MRLTSMLVLVVPLVVSPAVSAQRDYSVCSQMVTDAAHNVGVTRESYDYAASIFEQNCETDGSVKSSHLDFSIVVKAIPIGFNQGNDEQAVRNFCKTFSQDVRLKTDSFGYKSQVVDASLKTAVQCVDIITKGGTIVHRFLGADTLSVSVSASIGQRVVIQGLQPGVNTKCVSPGRLMTVNWDINQTHTVTANDGTYTIVCTRTGTPRPDLGQGVEFFNRTNIVMGTNLGGYNVFWPDQHVEPERDAEQIAANLTALQNQVNQLQARLNAIGTDTDQPRQGFMEGQPGYLVCPAGQFVSGIGATKWTSDHIDAGIDMIQFQCRKAVAP